MNNIFQTGKFKLSSGRDSTFKIECDNLTDEDIETFAELIGSSFSFKSVEGVPTGGLRLAKALESYIDPGSGVHLIVDDVLTTGMTLCRAYQKAYDRGERVVKAIVLFNRGDDNSVMGGVWDDDTSSIFCMNEFWEV